MDNTGGKGKNLSEATILGNKKQKPEGKTAVCLEGKEIKKPKEIVIRKTCVNELHAKLIHPG